MAQPDLSTQGIGSEVDALGKILNYYDMVPMADQQAASLDQSAANIRQLFSDYQKPEKKTILSHVPAVATGIGALVDLLSGDSERQAAIAPKVSVITDKVRALRDQKKAEKRQKFLDAMGVEATTADMGSRGYSARAAARADANQNKRSTLNDVQQVMGTRQSAFNAGEELKLRREMFKDDQSWREYQKQKDKMDREAQDAQADLSPQAVVAGILQEEMAAATELYKDVLKNEGIDPASRQKVFDEIESVAERRTAKRLGISVEQLRAQIQGNDTADVINPADFVPAEGPSAPVTSGLDQYLGSGSGPIRLGSRGEAGLNALAGILPPWLDWSPLSQLLKDRIEKQRLAKWRSNVKKRFEIVGQ